MNKETEEQKKEDYKYNLKKYNAISKKNYSDIYNITIDKFEGPLDLLCYLVKNNQMDIYNINLSEISEQYFEYLSTMQKLNLEIASEFIVMASNLLYIKSKKILPQKHEEIDEEQEAQDLINKLIEYNLYKEASNKLKNEYNLYNYRIIKPKSYIEFEKKEFNEKYDKQILGKMYKLQILKYKEKVNQKKNDIEKLVLKENFTIKSKLKEIFVILKSTKKFVFNKLFVNNKKSKQEVVVAFMAMLEMSKKDKILINQREIFGEIEVVKKEEQGEK